MGRLLTATQQDQYAREGFVFPVPVLSADEARRFRAASDELEDRLGGRPRTIDVRQMHLHFRWAYDLTTHPRVLDAVEDLLGPDLLVWATELFAKHPGDGAVSIGWHRDEPYMGLEARWTATAWIALGESQAANGCMRVVPGSAMRGAPEANGNGRAAEQPRADDEIVDVVLRPGEMSLHDARVLHGSGPNRSDVKRVGFVVRFVAPQARTVQSRPPAVLVRGRDVYGHFDLLDPPLADDAEAAVSGLRQSAVRHFDAVLENLERGRG